MCIALPFIANRSHFLPSISATFLGTEDFHKTLLYFVIPSSIIALSLGCKMHGKYEVYSYGFFGIGALLFASFFGHDYFGEVGEISITLIGAGIVSLGHYKNQKLCADCCS